MYDPELDLYWDREEKSYLKNITGNIGKILIWTVS